MPKTPHPIGIHIYGIDNQAVEGATVTLTLNSESISETTNSKGEVILNTANLPSGWSVGDEASITASKTGEGTKTETLTLTSSPQTLDMTLAETSDYIIGEEGTDQLKLNMVMPVTYDGEKVTHSNPLPVKIVDDNGINVNREFIKVYDYQGGNLVVYEGKALPGTKKGKAKWQIKKYIYSGNFVTDIQFAGGTDEFNKTWNNRTSYNYS